MGALQIAKRRRQRHFYIGGSCRMTRLRLALRVVAAAAPLSRFATRTCRCIRLILRLTLANAVALFKIVPDNFVESYIADSKKAPLGRFLHWWVVQDSHQKLTRTLQVR
jgi:hypothetical protein